MERINIAELLEDCPKGMELYSPIFGKVYLDKVRPHLGIVVTTDKYKEEFLYDGRYGMNGECMLFPSKDKTTWEGFIPPCEFKDGDIYYIKDVFGLEFVSIIKKCENNKLYTYVDIGINTKSFYCDESEGLCYCKDIIEHRLVTEEEKKKLFDAIKSHGYKWNEETKTLEKLVEPRFKVGDIIQDIIGICKVKITEVNVKDEYYLYKSLNINGIGGISFNRQNDWVLVPEKFDITTLVPFESRVLVRDNVESIWFPCFFGGLSDINDYPYRIVGGESWKCCIPYKGNEHLLGTTNDCDDFYKTWE